MSACGTYLNDCRVLSDWLTLLDIMSHTLSSALLPPVTSLMKLLLPDDGIITASPSASEVVPSREAIQVMYSVELLLRVVMCLPSQRECTKV